MIQFNHKKIKEYEVNKLKGQEHSGRIIIKSEFHSDLESYRFDMSDDSGGKYSFVLNGNRLYSPNRSSRCGYGSDEWFFDCKYNDRDCILNFGYSVEYGDAVWGFHFINEDDSIRLAGSTEDVWLDVFYSVPRKLRIYRLHPVDVDSAKKIVKSTRSRIGLLTDEDFYG